MTCISAKSRSGGDLAINVPAAVQRSNPRSVILNGGSKIWQTMSMSKGRKREPMGDDDFRLLVAGIGILLALMMLVIYMFDL